jgi:hypothetical protein
MQSGGLRNTLWWLTLFSMSMGYLESSVVVYLRELYYPSGFDFPMVHMPYNIFFTEVLREVATLLMLFSVAFMAGKNNRQRFAWFLFNFAIWDIFYYVFLKLLLNWPDSLFTWDILFMIPLVWTGPVLAPIISSVTMILLAGTLLYSDGQSADFRLQWLAILLIIFGAIIVFLSYIGDFSIFMLKHYSFTALFRYNLNQEALKQYVPVHFNWCLFTSGELLLFTGLSLSFFRHQKRDPTEKARSLLHEI